MTLLNELNFTLDGFMSIKAVLSILILLGCASSLKAETVSESGLTQLRDVTVYMQRMLKSTDGRYLLDIYSGVWNPHGTLFNLENGRAVSFEGFQKGNSIEMKSFNPELGDAAKGMYSLSGDLNAQSGEMSALFSQRDGVSENISFKPMVQVSERPAFVFKLYGYWDDKAYKHYIKRIDVQDKRTGQTVQQLDGFSAFAYGINYKDMNFDGYFDLVLDDASEGKRLEDNYQIYWMYNPQTKKFQRSPQLEKIKGSAHLDGVNRQVSFGNGQNYQVEKGLFKRIQ